MTRDDLTATSFLTGRLVSLVMVCMGLYFAFQPQWLGWNELARLFGGETKLLGFGVACSFFIAASLAIEKNDLRVRVAEVFTALNQLLYGKNYVRDRELVEILIGAMEGASDPSAVQVAYEKLKDVTGQHFAADPAVWRSWWTASRAHFEVRREGLPKRKGKPAGDPTGDPTGEPTGSTPGDPKAEAED